MNSDRFLGHVQYFSQTPLFREIDGSLKPVFNFVAPSLPAVPSRDKLKLYSTMPYKTSPNSQVASGREPCTKAKSYFKVFRSKYSPCPLFPYRLSVRKLQFPIDPKLFAKVFGRSRTFDRTLDSLVQQAASYLLMTDGRPPCGAPRLQMAVEMRHIRA